MTSRLDQWFPRLFGFHVMTINVRFGVQAAVMRVGDSVRMVSCQAIAVVVRRVWDMVRLLVPAVDANDLRDC